ncbi:MAG: FIST N-terminal domain-containing protein [Microcoleaceae cyanobacterium]
MQWVSALSTRPSLEASVQQVVQQAQDTLTAPPNLGIVFISSSFASEYSRLMPLLQEHLALPHLIGCSGGGIVGMSDLEQAAEVEGKPAISLCLAHLPEVKIKPFQLSPQDLPDLDSPPQAWVEQVGVSPEDQPQFILLIDPMSSRINDLLQGLDYAYPGSTKIGGLASGGMAGGTTAVFSQDQVYSGATVGVALSGNITIESIVAQGCRPIGPVYRVTQGDRNILLEVEPEPDSANTGNTSPLSPLAALQELIQTLDEADRELAQNSLFVGVVRDEFKLSLEPGDFLIRNLMGVDPRVGAIAIGDRVRAGQRIRFHLRDARTSAEDLELLLKSYQINHPSSSTDLSGAGALMFSCLGRGEHLYEQPNFDSQLFRRYLNLPMSGFFCNGEIGPVGGGTFLHGYTSVFGICRPL